MDKTLHLKREQRSERSTASEPKDDSLWYHHQENKTYSKEKVPFKGKRVPGSKSTFKKELIKFSPRPMKFQTVNDEQE